MKKEKREDGERDWGLRLIRLMKWWGLREGRIFLREVLRGLFWGFFRV